MIEELYINSNYIELGEISKIGVTFQVNDIANLANRQGTFSNEFKVPKTKNNQIALEFCSVLNSNSLVPYSKNTARYLQNGIEIVSNGLAIVKSYSGYYKIQITDANVNISDIIGDDLIGELDYTEYELDWTLTSIIMQNQNSDGIIYPIIDYNGASPTIAQIDVRRLMPAVFAPIILEKLFDKIDYTYSGDFKTGPFESLLIPLHTDKGQADFFITIDSDQNFLVETAIEEYSAIPVLNTRTLDLNNNWVYGDLITTGSGVDEYGNGTPIENIQGWYFLADVASNYEFTVSLPFSAATGLFAVVLANISSGYVSETFCQVLENTASGTVTFVQSVFLQAGDKTAILCENPFADVVFENGASCSVKRNQVSEHVEFGQVFPVGINLPAIKQIDFIKIVCQLYCLYFQTDYYAKNVAFNSFSKIKENIPLSLDWSDLFDATMPFTIEYTIGDYAQTNIFQYKVDDSVNDGELLHSGNLYVNNETLPLSKVAVQLPFAETLMSTKLDGLDVPYINKYNVVTDYFDLKTEPRLLYLSRKNTSMKYYDGTTDQTESFSIPCCYFMLDGNANNLGFSNNLIEENYSELQSVLINVKKVTGFLKLNATHISNLDFSIPIFLNVHAPKMQINGYFYLNKIGDFTSGKLSQTELIRL